MLLFSPSISGMKCHILQSGPLTFPGATFCQTKMLFFLQPSSMTQLFSTHSSVTCLILEQDLYVYFSILPRIKCAFTGKTPVFNQRSNSSRTRDAVLCWVKISTLYTEASQLKEQELTWILKIEFVLLHWRTLKVQKSPNMWGWVSLSVVW